MVIQSERHFPLLMQEKTLAYKRSRLWLFILCFGILGSLLGLTTVQLLPPEWAIVLNSSISLAWANSSFDPQQQSRVNQAWQYVVPIVLSVCGLICIPMGFFIGNLAGFRLVGTFIGGGIGIIVGVTCLMSFVFLRSLLLLTIYQTQRFLDYIASPCSGKSPANVQAPIPAFTFESAQIALTWSVLQGIVMTVLIAAMTFGEGELGIIKAICWHVALIITLISFHTTFQSQIRRLQRFVLLFCALSISSFISVLI